MKVLVLGAGVVGVTTAWFLNKSGHEVTVLERRDAAGMETSFANGGQISVSHAEPWANPSAPLKVLKWLAREDAPLLFRLRPDFRQWLWGLSFLRECTPARTRHNIRRIVALGLYSRATLQALRAETGIAYDQLARGILHFYTNERELDAAIEPARVMRSYGCDIEMLSPQRCIEIEPALKSASHLLVGGSFTASDESGDAHRFTQNLARLAASRGVKFLYGRHISGLAREGDRIAGVCLEDEMLKADAYVLALGSYSPLLARSVGIRLNIYPAKGYSATVPLADPAKAYAVSLTDDEYKLVFSRLGDRLRIAGTAELNGYSTELNPVRCQALLRRTEALFPGAGDMSRAQFWTGLRPATPSNVPYIGATPYPNLYLNTGHGTLGWTHACGSARALADIICGREPEIEFGFLARKAVSRRAGRPRPAPRASPT
ncbi:MAG TPA: D-amino acid dehydrogenase [Burkholderiales bacterium]